MIDSSGIDRPAKQHGSASAFVHIRVLGEFAFDFGGQPVATSAWQRSHAKRLIQLLCCAPRFTVTRPRLIAALWPGFDDERARNRLHHTIHCVRKAWEEIPAAARPQIVVSSERVEMLPAPDTVIDVQVFVQGVESDCTEASARLMCLEASLEGYRGELAPGWDDCAEIEARRVWLAQLRESAMREVIDTALEVGRPAVALHHAHQLALLLESDCDAHCRYALLLADNGRPDAALLHCQHVRDLIEADNPQCLQQLATAVQSIQQSANRRSATGRSAPQAAPAVEAASRLVSRLCVPAPMRRLIGYDALLQMCGKCIEDPFSAVISLVGPPGSGKSLLASTVAHRLQSTLQHGALWIDCAEVTEPQGLLDALADALTPLCGTLAADETTLRQWLQNKEMLIVLDGLHRSAALVRQCMTLALAGRDTRWLVTAWTALRVMGERVIHIESSHLSKTHADGMPSHAAQIIHALSTSAWPIDDARSMRLFEQIGSALDGLPLSLEIAAHCLSSMSPNELWSRLQRDPATLMRSGHEDANAPAARLAVAVDLWLAQASPTACRMLSLLSRCKSWLTRDDIGCLMGEADTDAVDQLVEHCLRHQFLLRRTRLNEPTPTSEFRVPRIASAALRLRHDAADPAWCLRQIEAWLHCGHQAEHAGFDAHAAAAAHWFDHHIDDIDSAAIGWLEAGDLDRLASLCAAHAPHWALPAHAQRIGVWLTGLGDSMDGIDRALAPRLLLQRARLQVHLGHLHLACDDASRALARIVGEPDAALRQQAVQMIQRYGAARPSVMSRAHSTSGRGVEAGESLLRVAQIAVRHGQLCQAMQVCAQSVEVFTYFGLSHGLVKAHHYRAKIAFALGNTELALRCLSEVQRVAEHTDQGQEAARAGFMQAEVLLSRMCFSQAIDLSAKLMARPDYAADPALVARGMSVAAWAHYGQGAYALAHALCSDLRERAAQIGGARLKVNVEILSALIDARSNRPAAALRSACAALELVVSNQPLSDTQSDLINVAELALHLKRRDLALAMVRSLQQFSQQPEHRLRDWVAERLRSVVEAGRHLEPLESTASHTADATSSYAEALKRLARSNV